MRTMEDLKQAIREAGELATLADLARRWGVSRQAVQKMSRRPGFPSPLAASGGVALYVAKEADDYRNRGSA